MRAMPLHVNIADGPPDDTPAWDKAFSGGCLGVLIVVLLLAALVGGV